MTSKFKKIDWFNLQKKYWKKTIILFSLITISTTLFILLTKNGIEKIYSSLRKGKDKSQLKYDFYWFGQKSLIDFGSSWKNYLGFMAFLAILSCLLVAVSYYYRSYFVNLIVSDYKKKAINKLFRLKEESTEKKKKKMLDIISRQIQILGDYFVNINDQIWVFFIILLLVIWEVRLASFNSLHWGLAYFVLATLLGFALDHWLRRKDLSLQKDLEKQIYEENNLINNRRIIIKKGLVDNLTERYFHSVQIVKEKANQESLVSNLYKAIFQHLIKFAKFFLFIIMLLFASDVNEFIILDMFARLSTSSTYLIKGLRKYPRYSSARKQINDFFNNQPERDDIQKNLIISEKIESLSLKGIVFSYKANKLVFNELDLNFQKGKINYLQAHNGFGKTTVVNLLFGLYQPSKGKILINDQYKLDEINLIKWRKKIAYAEHNNLVEVNLSTGQKQLLDLNQTLAQKNKDVFIFDEADNSLDEAKKKKFQSSLEQLSKNKLVIFLSAKN